MVTHILVHVVLATLLVQSALCRTHVHTNAPNYILPTHMRLGPINNTLVYDYVTRMKQSNKEATVVDVGGSAAAWSGAISDAFIDINPPPGSVKQYFRIDVNDPTTWREILSYVRKYGKFDFSICTHTVEDLPNPVLAFRLLEQISVEGYISVPTKYHEMCFVESPTYRGYIHHRSMFTIRNGQLCVLPKLNFLDKSPTASKVACCDDRVTELGFFWTKKVPFTVLNNGYMGPNVNAVHTYFDDEMLTPDDLDEKYKVVVNDSKLVSIKYVDVRV